MRSSRLDTRRQAAEGRTLFGLVQAVTSENAGSTIAGSASPGDGTVTLDSVLEFSDNGGTLRIGGDDFSAEIHDYLALDDDTQVITLADTVLGSWGGATLVELYPLAVERVAQVSLDGIGGEVILARVPHALYPLLAEGFRNKNTGQCESVALHFDGRDWVISDVVGHDPLIDPTVISTVAIEGGMFYWEDASTHSFSVNLSGPQDFEALTSGRSPALQFSAPTKLYLWTLAEMKNVDTHQSEIALQVGVDIGGGPSYGLRVLNTFGADSNSRTCVNMRSLTLSSLAGLTDIKLFWSFQLGFGNTHTDVVVTKMKMMGIAFYDPPDGAGFTDSEVTAAAYGQTESEL